MKHTAYASFAVAGLAIFGLTACGDDTTNNNYSTVAIEDYTLKTLPKCDSTMEGQVGFVTTTAELMYCMSGEWKNLNGANGAPGDSGAPGKPGDPGEDCTAKQLNDKSGYKIICGKDSVGVVLNGEKGAPGNPGDPGESCKMTKVTDMGDTVAMVTCKKDTVWLMNGKNVEGSGSGEGTGSGEGPENQQTTLTEGSVMQNGDVIIGDQVWMSQNINDPTKGGACYENKESNCEIFGRLYAWTEAMAIDVEYVEKTNDEVTDKWYQGICPDGYHIPTGIDWQNLFDYVNSSEIAKKIREEHPEAPYELDEYSDVEGLILRGTNYNTDGKSIWTSKTGAVPAFDSYHFMVVGAGVADDFHYKNDVEEYGYNPSEWNFNGSKEEASFWLPENEDDYAGIVVFNFDGKRSYTNSGTWKNYARSVRCIRNMSATDFMKTDEYKKQFETPETPAAGN